MHKDGNLNGFWPLAAILGFFASVQNCSNFRVWHSTDLDSAGRNHIETIKKLFVKKTRFHVLWHDFARTKSRIDGSRIID